MTSPNAYYICPVCKLPTTRHWNMKQHMKRMHPECKKKPKHVFLRAPTFCCPHCGAKL